MAATSMKLDGKHSVMFERAIVTVPSSSGCRSDLQHVAREIREFVQKQDAVDAPG